MPLLAYCMMEAERAVEVPTTGVAHSPVHDLTCSGLRCFFSAFNTREEISKVPAVEAGLAFHRVVHDLFQQAVVIPFRFPTVVDTEEELREYVEEHAGKHREALERLREMVQMEIRVGQQPAESRKATSGSDYLKQRQAQISELQHAADSFRQATVPWTAGWRQRETSTGIRCYALIGRDAVKAFEQAVHLAGRESRIPARMSGPWPPTQFLD